MMLIVIPQSEIKIFLKNHAMNRQKQYDSSYEPLIIDYNQKNDQFSLNTKYQKTKRIFIFGTWEYHRWKAEIMRMMKQLIILRIHVCIASILLILCHILNEYFYVFKGYN